MLLKELLKTKKQDIAILFFNSKQKLECKRYSKKDYNKIDEELLKGEIMEMKEEEDCLEIWVIPKGYF